MNTKIEIGRLDISKVLLVLFINVYRKSEESKKTYSNLLTWTPDEIGIYSIPSEGEIKNFINGKKYIRSIGCVKFEMDISPDVIDTSYYDKIHKTGENGILVAREAISEFVKQKLEHELKTAFILGSLIQEDDSHTSHGSNVHTLFANQSIDNDRRFTKSNKPGILYEASSYGYITDEVLKGYGFHESQWERSKDSIDNIVIIKDPAYLASYCKENNSRNRMIETPKNGDVSCESTSLKPYVSDRYFKQSTNMLLDHLKNDIKADSEPEDNFVFDVD